MTTLPRYRIGFDIGGTFTDFILLDTKRNEIRLHKCLTTPDDPSVGALEGLAELRRRRRPRRSPTSATSCTAPRWSPTR